MHRYWFVAKSVVMEPVLIPELSVNSEMKPLWIHWHHRTSFGVIRNNESIHDAQTSFTMESRRRQDKDMNLDVSPHWHCLRNFPLGQGRNGECDSCVLLCVDV